MFFILMHIQIIESNDNRYWIYYVKTEIQTKHSFKKEISTLVMRHRVQVSTYIYHNHNHSSFTGYKRVDTQKACS